VVVTETLRRRLIDQYDVAASKVRVIENAADTDLFRPSNPMLARSSLGLGEGPVVLFVGNLAPWQGVDVLVRAFKVLSRHNAAAHLVVVGDGQTRPGLEELVSELGISKQVRFLGAVPYEQVPTMIAAADVCVAPMTRERLKSGSSAIKVHEYLACERPVVASRIPGLEFLETEGVGILVPPEDEQALASALARVLEDAEWRRSAGARGRALVLKKASWTSVAEAVEEVCLKAVTA
jgi:glycosyltransferase involved in cell wall biosynthesis